MSISSSVLRTLAVATLVVMPAVSGACGETVSIDVRMGACSESAYAGLQSLDAVLKRDDGASWLPPCVPTSQQIVTTDDLSQALASSFTFRDVPAGGTWTLVVKGFSDTRCLTPLFCGSTTGFSLPPAGPVVVEINCPPQFPLEAYKKCTRE